MSVTECNRRIHLLRVISPTNGTICMDHDTSEHIHLDATIDCTRVKGM